MTEVVSVAPARLSDVIGRGAMLSHWWLRSLAVLLLLYAVFGKGSAYIGVGPLYVGEMVLGLGLLLVAAQGVDRRLITEPTNAFLLLFICWGAALTVPNIPVYGLTALRDAALWGYGIFALLVATALGRTANPVRAVTGFLRMYAPCVLVGAPLVYLSGKAFDGQVPSWPGSEYHLLYHKPGDVMVHLALVYAAAVNGAMPWSLRWAFPLALAAVCVAPFNRGGVVVLLAVGFTAVIPRHANRRWPFLIASTSIALIALLALTGMRIELSDFNHREISFQQITENISSLVGGEATGNQHDNVRWRLQWWDAIVERLPEQGREWTGIGFGPHIARDFGVIYTPIDARSPHNVWLTIYARMGFIGIFLWLGLLLAWFHRVASRIGRARAEGEYQRSALLIVAMLGMLGFLINASVDIFLEGPVGGIWFWCLIGAGLALAAPTPSGPNQVPDKEGSVSVMDVPEKHRHG